MKLHEIRSDETHLDDSRALECWHWLDERLISPKLTYDEFLDRLRVNQDTYIFDYAHKPTQMKFEGEWEGSPIKIRAGSINFRDSDCRKLEVESLVDGEMNFYLTRCPVGNLNRLASSIQKINLLNIVGTEDVTGVCEYIGALTEYKEFVLRLDGIDIDADHRKIQGFDRSSQWVDESKFDNVFDFQAWLIEKGFEYLV